MHSEDIMSEVASVTSPSTVTGMGSASHVQSASFSSCFATPYSKVVQTAKPPTDDQAIIMGALENTGIRDYALAIGSIVKPDNMISISRMSNNRVCVYLKNAELANSLINVTKELFVNKQAVAIKSLKASLTRPTATKYVVSNVLPSVPDQVIVDAVRKRGVRVLGKISTVKSGVPDQGYEHLICHRRLIYINQEDVGKMPETVKLTKDGVNFFIYFSCSKIKCLLCKEEGHVARSCKNIENSQEMDTEPTQNLDKNSESEIGDFTDGKRDPIAPSVNSDAPSTDVFDLMPPPLSVQPRNKRALSSQDSLASSKGEGDKNEKEELKKLKKKKVASKKNFSTVTVDKKFEVEDVDDPSHQELLKRMFTDQETLNYFRNAYCEFYVAEEDLEDDEPSRFDISLFKFCEFYVKCYGVQRLDSLAAEIGIETTDILTYIDALLDCKDQISNNHVNRLSRIKKRVDARGGVESVSDEASSQASMEIG